MANITKEIWEKLMGESQHNVADPLMYGKEYLNGKWDDSYRQSANASVDLLSVVGEVGMSLSIPNLLFLLSKQKEGYFSLEDTPCAKDHYTKEFFNRKPIKEGFFKGVTVEKRRNPPNNNNELRFSAYITMPDVEVSVFRGLSTFLDTQYYSSRLLGILTDADDGWLDTNNKDVYIQVDLREDATSLLAGGRKEISPWSVISASMHVGKWKFKQYVTPASNTMALLMGNGFKDQIGLTIEGSKGLEEMIIYTDPTGYHPPLYDVIHHGDLKGMREATVWTKKELALLEMMEIRNEIFIDTENPPRIMSLLRKVGDHHLSNSHNYNRIALCPKNW